MRSEDGSVPAAQGGGGPGGTKVAAVCYDKSITALSADIASEWRGSLTKPSRNASIFVVAI